MKCGAAFTIAALGALAACQSPAGLSQQVPTWSSTYSVPYEAMANCLAERSQLPWVKVTPAFYPQERRATVTVTTPTGSALGTFDIQQISARDTAVTYRSIYGGPDSSAGGDARNKADRCANSV
jgi:hypothetical protein